ncbi:hypothetical protein [Catenulispora subtropica]|uniref:Peptidase C39-like domain-containing protein n=1 Tax=Catenulispora subtropica TaxID=450798 RepID=A0ABP5DRP1_9ACTN
MLRPRIGTPFAHAVAVAATGVLLCQAGTAAAVTRGAADTRSGTGSKGLVEQQINGYTDACGPAAAVTVAAEMLSRIGIGNVALYTGPGRTGRGCVVVTGNGQPIGTDFQIMHMTAANVANYTDEPVAVYSDLTDNLDAVVPARTDADITPVDVNFAFYPEGTTPPPDDRGLIPTAVFQFPS